MERMSRADLLAESLEIAESYGGNLTVRQLYYRLVAGGLIASDQKEYKRLVNVLSKARLEGDFPLEWLMDRTRTASSGDYTENMDSVPSALSQATRWFNLFPNQLLNRARWFGQATHVSVWVEKEALAGVFEEPCEELGVGLFVCRGYPSVSSLFQWLQGLEEAYETNPEISEAVILYFGDHDPDGWEIPRSALRNIEQIVDVQNLYTPPIHLERIALLMDQIVQFRPPPFPAKVTSSRFASYFEEHDTEDAWELDALDPPVLARLIENSVEEYFDEGLYQDHLEHISDLRDEMRSEMRTDDWIRNALGI